MRTERPGRWLLLLLFAATLASGRQPDAKDRCTEWMGPYGGGVFYRYCQSSIGMDTWSSDYDCYQFKNNTPRRVAVTWVTVKGKEASGPMRCELEVNGIGELTSLPPGARIQKIEVVPMKPKVPAATDSRRNP